MGGCNERYEISDEEVERATKQRNKEDRRKKAERQFLLKIKKAFLAKKPLPDFLSAWDKLPKGPKVDKKEFEAFKQRIATHCTPIISLDVVVVRRLLQTLEANILEKEEGIIEELPEIGKEIIVDSSGWDDFPGVVVAHLPRGIVLAYEPGYPDGDGGTTGKMHVLYGTLAGLNLNKIKF